MKIGLFDSGFGGIDILRHITELLPEYDYVYLGDNARSPYGNRSQEILEEYATEATQFLFEQNCQLVLFACNTASTLALRTIQQNFIPNNYEGRNALGVIIPACEEAVKEGSTIGVIATQASVDSQAFERELYKLKPDCKVITEACPLLVSFVETREQDDEIIVKVLKRYLKPLVDQGIDTLILGCTHYGLLEKQIIEVLEELGSQAKIIHEGRVVAQKFKDYLKHHPEYQLKLSKNSTRIFFATDLNKDFEQKGGEFFGERIQVKKAQL